MSALYEIDGIKNKEIEVKAKEKANQHQQKCQIVTMTNKNEMHLESVSSQIIPEDFIKY